MRKPRRRGPGKSSPLPSPHGGLHPLRPIPVTCARSAYLPQPRYTWKQYPADMLFQGMFGEMARRDAKVKPARVAASLGFVVDKWKTLETGCELDNYIFRLKKQ